LDEFCKFNTFVDFLRSQNVKEKILEEDLSPELIVYYLQKQDAYYYKVN
jgi:hypothetical protein